MPEMMNLYRENVYLGSKVSGNDWLTLLFGACEKATYGWNAW